MPNANFQVIGSLQQVGNYIGPFATDHAPGSVKITTRTTAGVNTDVDFAIVVYEG